MLAPVDLLAGVVIVVMSFALSLYAVCYMIEKEREGLTQCPHCLYTISKNITRCPRCTGQIP